MTLLTGTGEPGGAGLPAGAGPGVLLSSPFDLGHQPFGLAVQKLDEDAVRAADLIEFYLPMNTATRILAGVVPRVRELNPAAYLCAHGLYAPVNQEMLTRTGVDSVIGGEFEEPLAALAADLRSHGASQHVTQLPVVSLGRQDFQVPDRSGLPALSEYAFLTLPDGSRRTVGCTEATRGASTCAGTARSCRSTAVSSRWCSATSCCRHPPAGRRGRAAHHLRRPGVLQRPRARRRDRAGTAC